MLAVRNIEGVLASLSSSADQCILGLESMSSGFTERRAYIANLGSWLACASNGLKVADNPVFRS